MTGARKPGPRGEHAGNRNTIARGRPDDLAEPVVTAACFFCCRRAMGAACTRSSLRPLSFRAALYGTNSGGRRRETAKLCLSKSRFPWLFDKLKRDRPVARLGVLKRRGRPVRRPRFYLLPFP